VALVGESSTGRKGTAMWRAHDAMADALDAVYVNRVILDGLNSGEGLISALAYKREAFPYEPTVGLVFEEEYASLLAARGRDGSTLDPKMRAAFDGGPLSNRRSNESRTVTPPYWLPALIGITPVELRRRLEPDALASGSANRWLYLPVRRRELEVASTAEPRLRQEHREALRAARRAALDARPFLTAEPAVTATLSAYADFLPGQSSGAAMDLTKRLPVIAFRIALVHAMAERAKGVTAEHLARALALTEYARSGIDWVFGGSVGNRDADLLLRHLRKSGRLTRRQAERALRDTLRRQDAIDELCRLGYAHVVTVHETRGRPRDELQLLGSMRTSSHFSPVPGIRTRPDTPISWDKGTNSVNGGDEVADEVGTNLGQRGAEVPVWALPCADYSAHRNDHRNTRAGCVCIACHPEVVA
jgi:hypothetical protein